MSASAQSIDHSAHRPSTSMTHQESPADRELAARVARFASQDRLFKAVTFLFAMLVLLGMFGILASLLVEAWPTLRTTGVAFFYGTTWSPTDDEYGAVIAIYGTVVTSAIALLIAVPVSFGIAMFLTESCPVVLRRPLGTAIELLAGVPSIIYGIWGLFVLAPLFQTIHPTAAGGHRAAVSSPVRRWASVCSPPAWCWR
jgi:phosphate transport system permease protein